jgi:hypothetical protein
MGYNATCNTGGAGKFTVEMRDPLKGRHVVIIPDKDVPGRTHAQQVAELLVGFAASVRLIEMPGDGIKDTTEWFEAGGNQEQFTNLIKTAQEIKAIETAEQKQEREQKEEETKLFNLAKLLLHDPGLLHKAICTVEETGVVGERKNIGIIHLQMRSRALTRPINIEVNSPSSSGKTHLVTGTLKLEDSSAYYELTGSSEKALIYLDKSLANCILYIQEPEGLAQGAGFAAIKSLFWEGRLKYDTVIKEDGDFANKHIEKEGPTGLIVTTTINLEEQLSNRLFRLEVDTDSDQTRRILGVIAANVNGNRKNIDMTCWHALSRLLGTTVDVKVPYSQYLAEHVAIKAMRIRRDFTHLLTLIQASAVEYQFQRDKTPEGIIIATVADYAHIYSLVKDVFQAAQEEGITKADRGMVTAVEKMTTPAGGKPGDTPISQAAIRAYLALSKSTVSYRVNRLLGLGYLVNLETQKNKPQKVVPGAPLPEEVPPLPSPCQVSEWLIENGMANLIRPWIDPITGESHNCTDHLPILQNRTPELPPSNPLIEANPPLIGEGSNTNQTLEPPPINETGSVSPVEAEPMASSLQSETNSNGSSVVRFTNDQGSKQINEENADREMPFEEFY